MNSTRLSGTQRARARLALLGFVLINVLLGAARAAENPVPRPPELERDVQFWVRVYSQIDTNSGFLHDQYNLGIVYDTLHFPPNTAPSERQRIVDEDRERLAAALKRIAAAGAAPLSAEDQHIKDLWGAEGTPEHLLAAVDDIRFQLGQSDRFRGGLVRSGAWETHIEETLANLGLPPELAVLPHVESSFNPAAYSKVGAAGLWQFMRSTGRRYMRIDSAVDDRLDPFRSTEAAAQLLAYNYHLLGTWPLALTAYNHGSAGMLRAKESMGSDDIVKIVRGYTSRSFGFASRNFYVSFLAALEIDRNPEKYFGPLQREPEAHFREIELPAYVSISALTRTLKMNSDRLRALNPALLPPVWSGTQRVPKAYRLRLPLEGDAWTSERLAQRLQPGDMFTAQRGPEHYKVQKGDTLVSIAAAYDVPVDMLARVNHLRTSARVVAGQGAGAARAERTGGCRRGAAGTGARRRRRRCPGEHGRAPVRRWRGAGGGRAARERGRCRRGRRRGGCVQAEALQRDVRGGLGGAGRSHRPVGRPRVRCRAERRSHRLLGVQATTPSASPPTRRSGTLPTGSAPVRSACATSTT